MKKFFVGASFFCTLWAAEPVALPHFTSSEGVVVNTPESFRLAVKDLIATSGASYPKGAEYLATYDSLEKELKTAGKDARLAIQQKMDALHVEALMANPLMNFDRLLLIKRSAKNLGLPQNWQVNSSLQGNFDNEIAILSPVRPGGTVQTFYKPEGSRFVGDLNLHFDADKLLFSSTATTNHWQVYEIDASGKNLRQVTPNDPAGDNFDATYLPDGRIIYTSTACNQGVPCVGGVDAVGNLYQLSADGKNVRRLTVDQDQNWCPTMLPDGRILYTRWEYSDTAHYFTRLLFHMNPDGSGQRSHLFSNSYWPNSTFYARPVPGSTSQIAAIVSGHHGVCRMGELFLFDTSLGDHEIEPVVQRIPGYGKPVVAKIADQLVDNSRPKFLHPAPLSTKYLLVSAQTSSNWGIYLVDVFDNMVLLAEQKDYALLEPVVFHSRPKPPSIPSAVNLEAKDATLILSDVYAGPGLAGVPRGTVKSLRLYALHFAYQGQGGHTIVGTDGPWDVRRILGTVPVESDGSAMIKVPANTPIAIQALDADDRALQIMRSWYTAMPGETLSCLGCHEKPNSAPISKPLLALKRAPSVITPWYGEARGFTFATEVQPVLNQYCIGCHDGTKVKQPDFRKGYAALHPYVRRPGPESDYHLQVPLEWHASTSELIQKLEKGHHNVKLSPEAWDRLTTWIDLNVPNLGAWKNSKSKDCRLAGNKLTTNNLDYDPDVLPPQGKLVQFVPPAPETPSTTKEPSAANWPFTADEAKRRQENAAMPVHGRVEFGKDLNLDLQLIPAGECVLGDASGEADERPLTKARIEKPFYMATCEITNDLYNLFDPRHNSGFISEAGKDQYKRGMAVNLGKQPVTRVSWRQAMAFCTWLSSKTGGHFTLPTEVQWEYSCRAGTTAAMNYGNVGTNFGLLANLADKNFLVGAARPFGGDNSGTWRLRIANVDDHAAATANVGTYKANAWGLYDMHGNVAEWTLSTYRPYPYDSNDGRENGNPEGKKVIRGGSYSDRPCNARSAVRLAYPSWQQVHNVGFRVVCEQLPKDNILQTTSKP